MKAVIVEAFGPFEPTRFRAVADPLPGKDEVRIVLMALRDGKVQGKIIHTTHG